MNGFKSFAAKTRLEFEPVLTCVVGPNGCGKSNISDAIRWVLGEQSAKAMRGSKMEDCIFSGTDARRPLGMAEVGVTFADCEETLGTEYSEVTVTRRVFRSGEGQYFINKTPCRLKDIQRLFMDTGIGTTSYSFMEQGRIDQILSSRPEDRRTVFEEASGITKFKADKKEALRKLEHTEANLLRLADVIREVKRQIGSLQRQAGKARRYKAGKQELRALDVYMTRGRLKTADQEIVKTQADIADAGQKLRAADNEVRELENGASVIRQSMTETEREIGSVMESGVQAQSKLDHTRELIRMNQQRIDEYRQWSERDSREIGETRKQLADKTQLLAELSKQKELAVAESRAAQEELKRCNDTYTAHQQDIDQARSHVQRLREESIEVESMISRHENRLVEIDSRQRSSVIQRERLSAEKAQLTRTAAVYSERQTEMTELLRGMTRDATRYDNALERLERDVREAAQKTRALEQGNADLRSRSAAAQARIEFLREAETAGEDLPTGSRLLLEESNPLGVDKTRLMGALAAHLDVDPDYRVALETCLHSWLDAVVVADAQMAFETLRQLENARRGAAKMLAVDLPVTQPSVAHEPPPSNGAKRLIDHVRCPQVLAPLVGRLIGNVLVVETLGEIPPSLAPDACYVTRTGSMVKGNGCAAFWMSEAGTPGVLSKKHLLAEAENELGRHEQAVETRRSAIDRALGRQAALEKAVQRVRARVDVKKRTAAQKEGESQIVDSEAKDARERLETVTWELDTLTTESTSGTDEKEDISRQLADLRAKREDITTKVSDRNRELQRLEARHTELQSEVTEQRVRFAGLSQKGEHLAGQCDAVGTRVQELEAELEGRSAGILSYHAGIEKLVQDVKNAEGQLTTLQESVSMNTARADSLRKNRDKQAEEVKEMEAALSRKRESQDGLRASKSDLDIRLTEAKMRRENQVDRITSEYSLTLEKVLQEPPPDWGDETPSMEQIETRVAELRTKLDAMGPVNLIAIEEYKELEERYAFLTEQEQDLVKAKQQLMDMIRKINRTTTEMFSKTFNAVNANFQDMFRKLFNGGSAKLVLVNEEDVLECGIEIIARPPGKRLQNVSLLSGGERTLTAVSLLFAIYMIRPSPFCLLDELDAALDDSNIGRFAKVLQDFLAQSQFLVITHNRQTIAAANALYGVTMPERGISNIVSMKFKEYEKEAPKQLVPAS